MLARISVPVLTQVHRDGVDLLHCWEHRSRWHAQWASITSVNLLLTCTAAAVAGPGAKLPERQQACHVLQWHAPEVQTLALVEVNQLT